MCVFKNNCRQSVVIYKATCKCCGQYYIGNTQQHLKERMNNHFQDTVRQIKYNINSDTFSKHFAQHFPNTTNVNARDIRNIVSMDILWHGNAIQCMKSFCTINCKLCMQERLAIHRAKIKEPDKVINSNHEIYGGCRHKTKFHRFINRNIGTDDGANPERALSPLSILSHSPNSQSRDLYNIETPKNSEDSMYCSNTVFFV